MDDSVNRRMFLHGPPSVPREPPALPHCGKLTLVAPACCTLLKLRDQRKITEVRTQVIKRT